MKNTQKTYHKYNLASDYPNIYLVLFLYNNSDKKDFLDLKAE